MFNQTFEITDVASLLVLTFIELLLSTDNAIVLGVLTHALPKELRKKALLIGSISAFFLRAIALLSISFLLKYYWIQILGGLYLIYLSVHHFIKKKQTSPLMPAAGRSFKKTILLIELFDVAFAIDSIVAGLAFIAATNVTAGLNPKLWIVYFGGMIGLFGIRYAAHLFSNLIDHFPRLEPTAYLLVAWIGLKLAYGVLDKKFSYHFPYEEIFWVVVILLILSGFLKPKTKKG